MDSTFQVQLVKIEAIVSDSADLGEDKDYEYMKYTTPEI